MVSTIFYSSCATFVTYWRGVYDIIVCILTTDRRPTTDFTLWKFKWS